MPGHAAPAPSPWGPDPFDLRDDGAIHQLAEVLAPPGQHQLVAARHRRKLVAHQLDLPQRPHLAFRQLQQRPPARPLHLIAGQLAHQQRILSPVVAYLGQHVHRHVHRRGPDLVAHNAHTIHATIGEMVIGPAQSIAPVALASQPAVEGRFHRNVATGCRPDQPVAPEGVLVGHHGAVDHVLGQPLAAHLHIVHVEVVLRRPHIGLQQPLAPRPVVADAVVADRVER